MLAQLHASGLLQSLLLKYMQAAYARMQTALIQVSLMRPTNPLCKIQGSIAMSHTMQALLDQAQMMLHSLHLHAKFKKLDLSMLRC